MKIKVFLTNGTAISLDDTNYRATGGEGSIYVKGGYAYKIWLDPDRAQKSGMAEKIRRLATIKDARLVTPQDTLSDGNGKLIGYRMLEIKGEPLMERFTTAWWDREHYDILKALALTKDMQQAMKTLHNQKALAIDANEMNWMVENENARLIDCDSWQIDQFKGTAIMPSITDLHTPGFSTDSDWFAWGVVSFQLLTGIHPYKGSHPAYKRGDMASRMKDNISVFSKEVRVPAAVRDFAAIPSTLQEWYRQTFDKGLRALPPENFTGPAVFAKKVIQPRVGRVLKTNLWSAPAKILDISPTGLAAYELGNAVAFFDIAANKALSERMTINEWKQGQSIMIKRDGQWVMVKLENGSISATGGVTGAITGNAMPSRASRLVVFGNRAYAILSDNTHGLQELSIVQAGKRTMVSVKSNWPIIPSSSKFFKTMISMDCMGKPFLMVPLEKSHMPFPAPSLQGCQILDGVGTSGMVMVVVMTAAGDMELRSLVKSGNAYEPTGFVEKVDVATPMTILGNGSILVIPEDDRGFLCSDQYPDGRWIEKTGLDMDMMLCGLADKLVGWNKKTVFWLKMS